MAETTVYDVECGRCGESTTVAVVRYPATRYEPASGDQSPEECEHCGEPFGEASRWLEIDPREDYDHDPEPYDWEP